MLSVTQPSRLDSPTDHDASQSAARGDQCIPNISPAGRRSRLQLGIISLGIGLLILAILVATGTGRLWRLPLFLIFWGATTGYFQWRDKTCISLASRHSRKLGDHTEKIEDAAELAQVQRQARRVQIKALLGAIPLTLLALLLPVLD